MTWLTNQVQNKLPVSPQQYVESAAYLNILIGEEHDKLIDLENQVAKIRQELLPNCKSVAEVKVHVEAEEVYAQMRKQQAYIKQIEETIRISKLYARMKNEEMYNQK